MTMWVKISQAIRHDDADAVVRYLNQQPECATQANDHDETLLHFAAKGGMPAIVAELLNRGAKPDQPDFYGWTPLHEACQRGHQDAVSLFLQVKPKLNVTTRKNHDSPLFLAAVNGHAGIVELLLKAGANAEVRNEQGDAPLHGAVRARHVKVMEILLDHGADIDGKNFMGETPLHITAHLGDFDLATRLLTYGAHPDEEDRHFRTFIDAAVRAGQTPFVEHFAKYVQNLKEKAAAAGETGQPVVAPPAIRKTIVMKVQDLATEALGPNLLRTFLFGPVRVKQSILYKIVDVVLWFLVFPFLLYVLWAGFHTQIIPGIVTFSGAARGDSMLLLAQTLLNVLIVFLISHWFVASDAGNVPFQHFFVYLRGNVGTRVIQFAVINVFFLNRLTFDAAFWQTGVLFWMMFLVLYTISFAFYWVDR
ncbi:MAG: hypothetical protein GX442_18280 [Candidatus Riflebacteria bacterium]|nr:hypothetical protein [Candidatus Riflebacteria bacterium]